MKTKEQIELRLLAIIQLLKDKRTDKDYLETQMETLEWVLEVAK